MNYMHVLHDGYEQHEHIGCSGRFGGIVQPRLNSPPENGGNCPSRG